MSVDILTLLKKQRTELDEAIQAYEQDDNSQSSNEDLKQAKKQDAITDEQVQSKAADVITDIAEDKLADAQGKEPDYANTSEDETKLVDAIEKDKQADKDVQGAQDESNNDHEDEEHEEEDEEEDEDEDEDEGRDAVDERLDELLGDKETETGSDVEDASEDIQNEEGEIAGDSGLQKELVDTKLELELVRAGIRPDRIEIAKKVFSEDFARNQSTEWLSEQISQYPEWFAKSGGKDFGMPIGDRENPMTATERRLKEVHGISMR